jgi:hypothetical protein
MVIILETEELLANLYDSDGHNRAHRCSMPRGTCLNEPPPEKGRNLSA